MKLLRTILLLLFFVRFTCAQDLGGPGETGAMAGSGLPIAPGLTRINLDVNTVSTSLYETSPFVTYLRSCCGEHWYQWESSRGSFNFSGLDSWVNLAIAHHAKPFFTWLGVPRWASGNPPALSNGDPDYWERPTDMYTSAACSGVLSGTTTTDCYIKEAAAAFMRHNCRPAGSSTDLSAQPVSPLVGVCRIKYIELWNEFNAKYWRANYHDLAVLFNDITHYTRLYCGDCEIILGSASAGGRGQNPSGETPDFDSGLLKVAQEQGALTPFYPPDAWSYHAYPARTNVIPPPFPTTIVSHSDPKCATTTRTVYCQVSIMDEPARVRAMMCDASVAAWACGLHLWNTESGWGETKALKGANTTQTNILWGSYVSQMMIVLSVPPAGQTTYAEDNMFYAYAADGWMPFHGSEAVLSCCKTEPVIPVGPTAVQLAWNQTLLWLNNTSFNSHQVTAVSISGGEKIWYVDMIHNAVTAKLIWCTNWLSSASYTVPAGFTHWQTLDGTIHSVTAGSTISLTQQPGLLYQ